MLIWGGALLVPILVWFRLGLEGFPGEAGA